jgi:hypothetical protein
VSPCGEGEALSYWSQSYPPSLARIKKRIKERIRVFVFIGENGLKGVSDPVPLRFQWWVRSPLFVDNFCLG